MSIYHFREASNIPHQWTLLNICQSKVQPSFSREKIVKFLSISICSCSLYYIIYIPLYDYILFGIPLYATILYLCSYVILYYDILCFYALMLLYVIIRTYRATILCDTVILCADTFKRLFAAVRKGKYNLLSKNIQNFFL